jgi:hypothetical protein
MRAAYRVVRQVPDSRDERDAWLDAQLVRGTLLHGYGRPIYGRDERIAAALRSLQRNDLRAGPALKRAFWLDGELRKRKDIAMNMAVYADQRSRPPLSFLPEHQSEARVISREP